MIWKIKPIPTEDFIRLSNWGRKKMNKQEEEKYWAAFTEWYNNERDNNSNPSLCDKSSTSG